MNHVTFLNHPWHQLKFLSVSPLAQLTAPADRLEIATRLAGAGVFMNWPSGFRNPDRLPQTRAYLAMPGRGPVSRFSNGTFRVIYAAKAHETCLAEMAHHHGQALRDSREPPGAARIFEALDLRTAGTFVDIRMGHGELHRPADYGPARALGMTCKVNREAGIVYRSVRKKGGECLAVLEGSTLRTCVLREIIAMRWDGERLA